MAELLPLSITLPSSDIDTSLAPEFQIEYPSYIPQGEKSTPWKNFTDGFYTNWLGQLSDFNNDYNELATPPALGIISPMYGYSYSVANQQPIPDDPDFKLGDFFDRNRDIIPYAHKFEDVHSERVANNVATHIRETLAAETRLERNEGFLENIPQVLGSVATPEIFLPVPALKGAGIVRSIIKSAGYGIPIIAGQEALRHYADPTATLDETYHNALVGIAVFGALGGAVGILNKLGGEKPNILGQRMAEEARTIVGKVDANNKPVPTLRSISQTESTGYGPYQVIPTGDTPTGFAPAFLGAEKLVSKQSAYARVVNFGVRAFEDLINRLAGDHGVASARNKIGMRTEPSAYLASEIWLARAGETLLDISNLHSRYLSGGKEAMSFAGFSLRSSLAKLPDSIRRIRGIGRPDGKLRLDEFEDAVFNAYIRAQTTGKITHKIPEVKAAAKRVQQFFKEFEEEGYKTGFLRQPNETILKTLEAERKIAIKNLLVQFNKKKYAASTLKGSGANILKLAFFKVPRKITTEWINKFIKKYEDLINKDDAIKDDAIFVTMFNYVKELNRKIDIEEWTLSTYQKTPTEKIKFYFPHRWNVGAIVQDSDNFKNILYKHIRDKINKSGYSNIPEKLDEIAENFVKESYDAILANAGFGIRSGLKIDETYKGPGYFYDGRASIAKIRVLDIPTELIKDFIDTDMKGIIREYARKAGIGIEYSRAFGDPTAEVAISKAAMQAAIEGKSMKEISNIVDEVRNVRDMVLGTIYSPNAFGVNEVRILKSWFTVTTLGKALFTNMVEVARPIWVLGVKENLGFALKALGDGKSIRLMSEELRKNTSSYYELSLGAVIREAIERGPDTFGALTKYGRVMERIARPLSYAASTPYYVLNGVGVFTTYLKHYTGFVAAESILRRCIEAGKGTITKGDLEFLASYGIGLEDAVKISKMPFQKSEGLIFSNSAKWKDEGSRKLFFNAIDAIQKRVVTTPTIADKPSIMMGILGKGANRREAAMLALPFQLKPWGFAANNKILISALQGRDASVMTGALMAIGIAYQMNALRTPSYVWDKMDIDQRLANAIDSSGVLALTSDLNYMMETFSQNTVGMRPLLGVDPKFGGVNDLDYYDSAGEVIGPAGGKLLDIYRAFNEGAPRDKANAIVNAVPLNNLLWIPDKFRSLAKKSLSEMFD